MPSSALTLHVGRAWHGHDIEDECTCPQEECGLVAMERANPDCPQHGADACRTMRQTHLSTLCMGRAEP